MFRLWTGSNFQVPTNLCYEKEPSRVPSTCKFVIHGFNFFWTSKCTLRAALQDLIYISLITFKRLQNWYTQLQLILNYQMHFQSRTSLFVCHPHLFLRLWRGWPTPRASLATPTVSTAISATKQVSSPAPRSNEVGSPLVAFLVEFSPSSTTYSFFFFDPYHM